MTIGELKEKLRDRAFKSINEIRDLHLRIVYQEIMCKVSNMQMKKIVEGFNLVKGDAAFIDEYCNALLILIEIEQTETGQEVREIYKQKPLTDDVTINGI